MMVNVGETVLSVPNVARRVNVLVASEAPTAAKPVMAPVAAFRVAPAGNAPEASEYVTLDGVAVATSVVILLEASLTVPMEPAAVTHTTAQELVKKGVVLVAMIVPDRPDTH